MTKYFLAATMVVVVLLAAFLLWQGWKPGSVPSICADEIRGYRQAIESSLIATTKNIEEIAVGLRGVQSKEHIEQLSKLTPSDFLAIKACDTQCRILERCLDTHPGDDVARACPTEYADYKGRMDSALKIVERLQQYEVEARNAAGAAATLAETQVQLKEAQGGVGASGGREQVLRQRVAAQEEALSRRILDLENSAKAVLDANSR